MKLLRLLSFPVTLVLLALCWIGCLIRSAIWKAEARRLYGEAARGATWGFYEIGGRRCSYRDGAFYQWLD